MLSIRFSFLVVLSLLSATHSSAQELTDGKLSKAVESIVAGLETLESSVNTLSVSFTGRTSSFFDGQFDSASLRHTYAEQWHVDLAGRGWNESKGSRTQKRQDGSSRSNEFHQRSCCDGNEGRCLTISSSGIGHESYSGSVQPTLMRHAVSPFDLTTQHQGKSIAEHIASGAKVIGVKQWDGHQVNVIQIKTVENDSQYMTRYWVDPSRDFVVVRRRNFVRETPESVWRVTYSVDCFKHAKSKEGLWLPKLAWVQMFALSPDEKEQGNALHRRDLRCDDWSVNDALDEQKLHFEFPPGLRVPGLAKDEDTKVEKSSNFFVQPIRTPLQRQILGSDKYDTYAKIDVTAYADVNTKQIDPSKFDFDAFRKELKSAVGNVGAKHAHLYLKLDYGALRTEDQLGLFTKAPVVELAKGCGFASVRTSNTYHGGGQLWQGLPEAPKDANDEMDLGDDDWHIFLVGTSLSRELIDGVDCAIIAKKQRSLDVKQLIEDKDMKRIAKSLEGVNVAGKSLRITLQLGDEKTNPNESEKLRATKQGSAMQTKVIDSLRAIGFGNIRLAIRIGYGTFNSDYPK